MEGKKNHFLLGKDYLVHGLRKLEKEIPRRKHKRQILVMGNSKETITLQKYFSREKTKKRILSCTFLRAQK